MFALDLFALNLFISNIDISSGIVRLLNSEKFNNLFVLIFFILTQILANSYLTLKKLFL